MPHQEYNRRAFMSNSLQLGLSGTVLSGLGTIPKGLSAASGNSFGRARSVIVMFSWGGMSHIDTFDMKPNAGSEIRGEFSRISTTIPGLKVCEHLPKMSQMMHHLALVRSVHHKSGDHRKAAYWNLTGHPPEDVGAAVAPPVLPNRKDWPSIGAQVAVAMKHDTRYSKRSKVTRLNPEALSDKAPDFKVNWDNLTVHSSALLSTDVLGPGHFSAGSFDNQDGHTNGGTVELIGMFSQAYAGDTPITRDQNGPTADFSEYVSGDGTAGDWGSDTHGRGGNLWLIGDGAPNKPGKGFGCHANKFITFDLKNVREEHFAKSEKPFVVTMKVGICGNPGVHPNAKGMGGVWLDGKEALVSRVLQRDQKSQLLEVPIEADARYLTLAMLNGDSSTFFDDIVLADVTLHEVSGELPELPKRPEEVEVESVAVNDSLAANLPRCLSVPYPLADRGLLNGQYGGFLGLEYDPVFVHPGEGQPFKGVSATSGSVDLAPKGVSRRRMAKRSQLLDGINRQFPWEHIDDPTGKAKATQDQALNMLLSPDVQLAFDLKREPKATRDLYGDHLGGKSALLARRLTDAGVPLVTVNVSAGDLNSGSGDHWDTHGDNFNRLKRDLLPPWDHAGASLLRDLVDSGRIEDTLVVFLTEFGRTPTINTSSGRDHFPNCYSVLFAGAGVQGGLVYGKSDKTASRPISGACTPEDIHATIFHALGIPSEYQIYDQEDRPLLMCDGTPLPIT